MENFKIISSNNFEKQLNEHNNNFCQLKFCSSATDVDFFSNLSRKLTNDF